MNGISHWKQTRREANNLLIQAAHACFSWTFTLPPCESELSAAVLLQWEFFCHGRMERSLFVYLPHCQGANELSLLRYGVCCRPPGSADAGFPQRRRRETHPVAKLYNMSGHSVWFSLSSVHSGRHVWRAAPYKSIQPGTHTYMLKIPTCCCSASRAPPAVWTSFFFFFFFRGEVGGGSVIRKKVWNVFRSHSESKFKSKVCLSVCLCYW